MKPIRSRKYLDYVKSLPCVVTGAPADDPHHLIGHGQGGMGTKASDLFAFPLTREQHTNLHNIGWREWEEQHGSQWKFVAMTIKQAVNDGVIKLWLNEL